MKTPPQIDYLRDLITRMREASPRNAIRGWAIRNAGCPWCQWLQVHPYWPSCMCRQPCGKTQCNRLDTVLALDLRPGMRVYLTSDVTPDIIAKVSDPYPDGMVAVTPTAGDSRLIAGDWPVRFARQEA